MNIDVVYQLLDRFEGSALSELSLEMEGVKLAVKKEMNAAGVSVAPVTGSATAAGVPAQPVQEAQTEAPVSNKDIKAPLVGIFYRAPGPDEKPFVEKGQQVKKGDVVGIIEAMKLMNEITATEDGTVVSIEAQDGAMVEYGQTLYRMN